VETQAPTAAAAAAAAVAASEVGECSTVFDHSGRIGPLGVMVIGPLSMRNLEMLLLLLLAELGVKLALPLDRVGLGGVVRMVVRHGFQSKYTHSAHFRVFAVEEKREEEKNKKQREREKRWLEC
jgi:hypothetical protein